ncbi:MAG: hypothetical protein P1U62_14845, partial [Alteraurantiacibacter sp. bin_em_oilr2.035]|nr:hypothetical protein [Alteraurantiacibacter sp. bin_em_oilr2.035]
ATGYCVRFPDQADFIIDADSLAVEGIPVREDDQDQVLVLFHNSIVPMLNNHRGQLHMHGSAVRCGNGAIGFLGLSRGGKTTLAGAFARAGHPFLTEDVLSIRHDEDGYTILPSRPVLRLFRDSAAQLLSRGPAPADEAKIAIPAGSDLPHWSEPCQLSALFLLGPGKSETTSIELMQSAEALTHLMRHSFILDVDDRHRLKAHFGRIAELAQGTNSFALDYPRRYSELDKVINTVSRLVTGEQND